MGNCAHIESGSDTMSIKLECATVNGEPTFYGYEGVTDCSGNPTWSFTWTNFPYKPANAAYSCSQGPVASYVFACVTDLCFTFEKQKNAKKNKNKHTYTHTHKIDR